MLCKYDGKGQKETEGAGKIFVIQIAQNQRGERKSRGISPTFID